MKCICPRCGNEMEDTGLDLWCNICKDFYYNLKNNKEKSGGNKGEL